MTALRHHLYRALHPRRYRQGQLAEQRHQILDHPPLVPPDYPAAPSRRNASVGREPGGPVGGLGAAL
ncbi:hypothetical protein [Streptomyces sp. URMC 123]|uniref:hypothetical protein n=1 Tax=Streptomyces sp. URMC 123 TaxID=3423403 RepID=UPI003F1AF94A